MKLFTLIATVALCSICAHAALYQTVGGNAYPDTLINYTITIRRRPTSIFRVKFDAGWVLCLC